MLVMLALLCDMTAFAATINVPDDQPTIQAGIDAAANRDTVLVAPGTYFENINFNGHNIVLASLFLTTGDNSYIALTVIDGDLSGSVVTFENKEDNTAVIIGFTIRNGYTNGCGGGIFCGEDSRPIISDNIIIENSSLHSGAGIYCRISHPTIINNTISENSVVIDTYWGDGGGIYCYSSTCIIKNNFINGNFCYLSGGGISCWASQPTIIDNTISGNSTVGPGGGIMLHQCDGTISGNTISGNSTGDRGGGISCWSSNPIIENNIISEDTASTYGGGICNMYSFPYIVNNTIRGNITYGKGGGIFSRPSYRSHSSIINNIIRGNITYGDGSGISPRSSYYPHSTIINNIISGNSAKYGGGIWCDSLNPVIINNTISGNTANDGGGLYINRYSCPILENTIISFNNSGGSVSCCPVSNPNLTCCNVYGNVGGDWIDCITDQAGVNGNFSADPLFCDMAAWDFHISGESPCAPANNTCGVLIGAFDVGCNCCEVRGDINHSGSSIDIADLVYLVDYMFVNGPEPPCFEEADVNGDGAPLIDISDLVYLVDYMFNSGPEPPACP